MKQKQYNIKLTTLTPVCIGTGITLSPYSDYVIDESEKRIYYVNQELIKKKLEEKLELIDEFVNSVASGMDNNRSNFKLEQFLAKRLGIDIRKHHLLQLPCEARGSKQLYTIIKNAGMQPYIPGSSIKGAVKTALLYDWLVNDNEGQDTVSGLLQNQDDKNPTNKIEQKFNRFNPGFSDSSLIGINRMECIDTRRFHIKKGKPDIPQTWESVTINASVNISLLVKEKEDYVYLEWPELQKAINQYAKAGNKCEWDILVDAAGKQMNNGIYNALYDFYEKMDTDISNAGTSTAYLKLGSGKGYYLNSVGLALFEADTTEDKSKFLEFLKWCGFGKVYKKETRRMEEYDLNSYDFPITRVLDIHKILPLGWVKLEIEK